MKKITEEEKKAQNALKERLAGRFSEKDINYILLKKGHYAGKHEAIKELHIIIMELYTDGFKKSQISRIVNRCRERIKQIIRKYS